MPSDHVSTPYCIRTLWLNLANMCVRFDPSIMAGVMRTLGTFSLEGTTKLEFVITVFRPRAKLSLRRRIEHAARALIRRAPPIYQDDASCQQPHGRGGTLRTMLRGFKLQPGSRNAIHSSRRAPTL